MTTQEPPRRRNPWKWIVLTVAAFVVLLVGGCSIITVAAVLTAGSSGDASSGSSGPSHAQKPSKPSDVQGSEAGAAGTKASQQPSAPQGPQDYLEVSGTPGIPFSCSVMHGDMRQTTVDGTVPQKIKLENMHDFAAISQDSCQKSGSKGTLKVALYVGGDLKSENSTSAAYGVASVGYLQ